MRPSLLGVVFRLTGRTVGSFKVLRLLGQGGMGDVYLAEDAQLGRYVAHKFLSGKLAHSPWAKRQFANVDGYRFIVMHYVEWERPDQPIQVGGYRHERARERTSLGT